MNEGHVDHITRHKVQGWALDSDDPNRSIDILIYVDGKAVSRTKANLPRPDVAARKNLNSALHGFSVPIRKFLDTTAPHHIQIKFADTNRPIPNGERNFLALDEYDETETLLAASKMSLSPLFLTHMPRSGSTMCMALLHSHPSIIVAEHYPFEVKPATYYARAARLLTEPANHEESASPTEFMRDPVHLGFNPFNHLEFHSVFKDSELRDHFFERSSRRILFDSLRSVAIDYYRHLAADQPKLSSCYFAEKCEAQGTTRQSLLALFPDAREILLIRDPRDLLCSTISYFKRPISDDLWRNLQNGCETIRQIVKERRKDTLILKYEALVFDRLSALKAVARFLDVSDDVWSQALGDNPGLFREHATTETPEKSVGRWRRDLSDDQRNACSRVFSKFLSEFEYNEDFSPQLGKRPV